MIELVSGYLSNRRVSVFYQQLVRYPGVWSCDLGSQTVRCPNGVLVGHVVAIANLSKANEIVVVVMLVDQSTVWYRIGSIGMISPIKPYSVNVIVL